MVKQALWPTAVLMLAACGTPLADGTFTGHVIGTGTTTTGGNTVFTTGTTSGTGMAGNGNNTVSGPPNCTTYGVPFNIDATVSGTVAPYDFRLTSQGAPVVAWTQNATAHVNYWNGTAWTGWGGSDTTGLGTANSALSLFLDANDVPYVAWGVHNTAVNIAIMKLWNGSAWVGLGGSDISAAAFSASTVPNVQVALNAGQPMLAWTQFNLSSTAPSTQIAVGTSYFDGFTWSPGSYSTGLESQSIGATATTLLPDKLGGMLLGWTSGQVAIGIYDQNQISPVGEAGGPQTLYYVGGTSVADPIALAQNANNQIIMAWTEASSTGGPYVAINTPGTLFWSSLGDGKGVNLTADPNAITSAPARRISMTTDTHGAPWLAWDDGQGHVKMLYFNGTAWAQSNGSGSATGIAGGVSAMWPKLQLTSKNQPVLSWLENGTTLRVCAWQTVAP